MSSGQLIIAPSFAYTLSKPVASEPGDVNVENHMNAKT